MNLVSHRQLMCMSHGLMLLVCAATVFDGLVCQAQQQLPPIVAKIKSAGEPASLVELAPKPIPASENAEEALHMVVPQIQDFDKKYKAFYETPVGKAWSDREEQGQLPTQEQAAAIRAIVDEHPIILKAFNEATKRDNYASQLDFNSTPHDFIGQAIDQIHAGWSRSLIRYIGWRMRLLASDGQSNDAVRIGIQMLRLTRLHDREPLIINHLVSVAMRGHTWGIISEILYRNEISPEVRAQLDRELALQDSQEPLVQALVSERAFSISDVKEQLAGVPDTFPVSTRMRNRDD